MFEAILITGGSVAFLILIDFIISFKKYKKNLSFWKNKLKTYKTKIMETQYGSIEYLREGEGVPILVSHGINGGFDQCLGLSELYVGNDYEIIAVSRFGYLAGTKGDQVLQYNKINNRIYWREYTTVSRAIKKYEWEDEK